MRRCESNPLELLEFQSRLENNRHPLRSMKCCCSQIPMLWLNNFLHRLPETRSLEQNYAPSNSRIAGSLLCFPNHQSNCHCRRYADERMTQCNQDNMLSCAQPYMALYWSRRLPPWNMR